jgi:hypothetical protein
MKIIKGFRECRNFISFEESTKILKDKKEIIVLDGMTTDFENYRFCPVKIVLEGDDIKRFKDFFMEGVKE